MPAIRYQRRFVQPIRERIKTHTIRATVPRGFRLGHFVGNLHLQHQMDAVLSLSGGISFGMNQANEALADVEAASAAAKH